MKKKKMGRKLLSFLLTLAMVVGLIPGMGMSVNAEESTKDPVPYMDWDDTEKKLVEKTGDNACEAYTEVTESITNWTEGWYVVNSNVTIPDRITVTGVVNLILCDNAALDAQKGITVISGDTLNIYGQTNGSGTLNAEKNEESAGIGGGYGQAGGVVTISGGIITANGGYRGAGIGGGNAGNGGNVTINGGNVTAIGGGYGAGIGGGNCYGNGGTVIINGGTVTATAGETPIGNSPAVGIGAGYIYGTGAIRSDGTLQIGTGMTVYGGDAPNPITVLSDLSVRKRYMIVKAPESVPYMAWDAGEKKLVEKTGDEACKEYEVVTTDTTTFEDGKWYVVSNSVTVSSRITVTGTVNLILTDGATLTATKGIDVPGTATLNIYAQNGGTGTLFAGTENGTTATLTSQDKAAGIGGGAGENTGSINIHGGKITAMGGFAPGIGGGYGIKPADRIYGGTIVIYGGEINTTAGSQSAGIGGASYNAGGSVTIYGGTINASSSQMAPGIGSGRGDETGVDVTIYGGNINAQGGNGYSGGTGIGGAYYGKCGNITINGGMVTAIGGVDDRGYGGPGIGGGESGKGIGNIVINGGTVTAIGKGGSAGIGGFRSDSGSAGANVTINGGTVIASGSTVEGAGEAFDEHTYDYIDVTYSCTGVAIGGCSYVDSNNTNNIGQNGDLILGEGCYLYGGASESPENDQSNYRAGAGSYTGDRYLYMTVNSVAPKSEQTITVADVTVTYGDIGKKVTATTEGDGTLSYAVKDGSADYIDVDASTGALTIKKIGTATVIVTAAETATYEQATKEVTVTINKANAVPATVTANNRTYDGTEKPLVTVTGETTGGTLKFAVTTEDQEPAADAYNLDTTSIPTKTDAGTYYVWYMVKGDENHNDTTPQVIEVTIGAIPTFAVSFNMNGHGDALPAQTVEKDKTAVMPADPKAEGYAFQGWFKDSECKELYDFKTPVTADITLYAGWEQDTSGVEDEANDWNLYEDPSEHQFLVKGISTPGTVENSNENSKNYYDAKLTGSIIFVSVKNDRKNAAKKANATLEFKLDNGSVVEFSLPVSYVKPTLKLTSTSGTIKKGAESVLKTDVLVKGDGKIFRSLDMTAVTVSGSGIGTVSKGADGSIEIKTTEAGKATINITKSGWDDSDPVTLTYTVKETADDVLSIYPAITSPIVLNSNAKTQAFSYDVLLNGAVPADGVLEIVDKNNCGLASVSGGKLVIAYKEGVKAGKYTITLKAGEAAAKVNIRVSDKALNKAITLKTLRNYDVVTGLSMVVRATLKDVNGTIEAVSVAENGFTARPAGNGTIYIGYSGNDYNKKKLKIGKLTLSLKISGIDEPVQIIMKNVKAKKRIPSVKAATVIIPGDKTAAEGEIIGTANIVSSVYLTYGRYVILDPDETKIVKTSKGVTATVNANDPKEINITNLKKKSGWVKVKLTYAGDVTKTIKIKVKRAGK